MYRKFRIIFMLFLLVVLAVGIQNSAQAFGWMKGEKGSLSIAAKEAGATDEQVKKIEQVSFDAQKKMIDLRAEVQRRQLDLKQSFQKNDVKASEMNKKIELVSQARTELQKVYYGMLLDMRNILGPDKFEKIRRMSAKKGSHRKDGRMKHDRPGKKGKKKMKMKGDKPSDEKPAETTTKVKES